MLLSSESLESYPNDSGFEALAGFFYATYFVAFTYAATPLFNSRIGGGK
jgi:hypothetical protein